MKKKLCTAALMLGIALMLLQLRAHAVDTPASASIILADDED